jgi:hypothetical protein
LSDSFFADDWGVEKKAPAPRKEVVRDKGEDGEVVAIKTFKPKASTASTSATPAVESKNIWAMLGAGAE